MLFMIGIYYIFIWLNVFFLFSVYVNVYYIRIWLGYITSYMVGI